MRQRRSQVVLRVVTALSLLLGGLTILPESALALTWTEGCVDYGTGGDANDCDPHGGAQISESHTAAFSTRTSVFYAPATGTSILFYSNIGGSGAPAAFDTVASYGQGFTLERVGTQTAYACWQDQTNLNLRFSATHDGGVSYTSPATLASTGDVGSWCSVWAISDSIVIVAYYDLTNTKWVALKSTNGGGSFAAGVDIQTGCNAVSIGGRMAGVNETTGFILFGCKAGGLETCQTTDGGATWFNCYTTGLAAGVRPKSFYRQGATTTFRAAYTPSGASPRILTSVNTGGTYSLLTVPADSMNPQSSDFLILDGDQSWVSLTCISDTLTTPGSQLGRASYTEDAGATWTAWEDTSTKIAPSGISTLTGNCNGLASSASLRPNREIVSIHGEETTTGSSATALVFGLANPGTIGAAASVSDFPAGSLTGFDIGPNGDTVIARVGTPGCGGCTIGGHDIRTYDGQTLTATANSPFDTDCDRYDGVLSIDSHVMYVECGSGCDAVDQDPCQFDIRDADLSSPSFGDCGDECPSDLDMSLIGSSVSDAGGDLVAEIGEVQPFPIDFSARSNSDIADVFGIGVAVVAMAYTGTNGILGVQAYTGYGNAVDSWRFAEKNVGTTTPDQLCTGLDSEGHYYVGSADSGGAPKIYGVTFDTDTRSDGRPVSVPFMTSRQGGSSALSGGKGIDCAGDEYVTIVEKGAGDVDQVYKVNLTTGTATLYDTVDGVARGVTLSGSTKHRFFAWVDGANLKIANATGAVTCTLTLPAGEDFYQMEMSFSAQQIWVATTDSINRYAIQAEGCTTPNPESDVGGSGGAGGGPTPTVGGGGPFAVAPIPGVGQFGSSIFWGFLVVGACVVGGFATFRSVGLASALGIVGVMLAWGLGFFTGPVVFALFAILALAAFLFVKMGS